MADSAIKRFMLKATEIENALAEVRDLQAALEGSGEMGVSEALDSMNPELRAMVEEPISPGADYADNARAIHEHLMRRKEAIKAESPEAYEIVESSFPANDHDNEQARG